ncbi:MAG: acyl-CoA acyltransferase [Epsilonproteobacteria bacterium]|nr:acyl-CoA acyltransferase [Campylobacterota bacterium]OIO17793.1 MAG: acyl-CoA acyltransferase [Helicobacteraceae bacterium CG1_02_36_14]PIP10491.1 MAG: acyl-CoA acyltransferase [Sulfurimonas sp. CG23_combo_of_CG06-09_8_20_14_all_36_33]PIS26941.1 MAG: acyl-CoA acyltransferase [Sulfurimonas sp. CG08_land_8_20_14_0_20_36_33]PIU35835.1 MAG: acyl-CoA acyltransferase [Sulfurimonas sp. CG07_land_8_20_14_0_80_36_56]PIV03412.1 MAG: acyl-CoA acyltransferase [Sulfurimonas sp. CG03_land_8_20_14_0_80_36
MSIKIRKAEVADAPFLAEMILQSSRAGKRFGIFDLIFLTNDNATILQNLEKLTQTTIKSRCHYTNFLVAEVDAICVGTLCTYEPRISTKQSFLDALEEIGYSENTIAELEVLNVCDFNLNTRTLMFDFMEEVDNYRDMGVLKALMQKSLLTARLKGYRIAQAIVEIGSLETILYYKKLGFKEIEEKECDVYKEKFGRLGLILLAIEF